MPLSSPVLKTLHLTLFQLPFRNRIPKACKALLMTPLKTHKVLKFAPLITNLFLATFPNFQGSGNFLI